MCCIQEMIFSLKGGISDPHWVKISINEVKNSIQVMMGNERIQRIIISPCVGNGEAAKCSRCADSSGAAFGTGEFDMETWLKAIAVYLFPDIFSSNPLKEEAIRVHHEKLS
ncbi:MAG: hypothetical protein HZA01_03875 [Nitrospinae bacterium]|nr:hypothetical protein [Nitrospinota bacterium]